MFLEDGDWQKADEYCERVLDQNPENAKAYLGKLMADLKVSSTEELKNCSQPFNSNGNYQKVLRFGDDSLKTELAGYVEDIKERNENARLSETYNNAVGVMNSAETECAYKVAAESFRGISGFKDSDVLADRCLEKAEICRKDAIAKAETDKIAAERKAEEKRISDEITARRTKKILLALGLVVAVCAVVLLVMKVIIPNSKYNAAVELYQEGNYEEAIAAFTALNEYKDSQEQIYNCKYNMAVEMYQSGQYQAAIEAFEELDGYKDSEIQIEKCYIGVYGEEKWNAIKNIKVGDRYIFGSYEQDNNRSNGKEDIEWLVLAREDNKILVISDKALDCQPYDTTRTDVTWESCSLRKWLNGTFIDNAFDSTEKTMIADRNVSADKNPDYDTDPGNSTTDNVFLLSITEVEKYFSSDEDRKCVPTEYSEECGILPVIGAKGIESTCWWFLRSPGSRQKYAAYVDYGGSVRYDGYYVSSDSAGVRPALWINLDS